jgi:hypothetical protein
MGITFAPSERRLRSLSPFSIMTSNPIVCASAAIARRRALEQASLADDDNGLRQYFRTCLRHAQDTDLWSRIAALPDWRIDCVRESLVSYRVHAGSSSASLESLEVSLLRLRTVFFDMHPETDTPEHHRLACGYHLRYLAQTAVLRSQSRSRPIAYIGRALMVSPAALRAEGKISLLTVASSLAQLVIGPYGTRWLIRVASPFCVG